MTDFETETKQALRQRAEEKLKACTTTQPKVRTLDEASHLLHELQVHQIELEMQNEELQRSQVKLAASQASFQDLYELAPVGYLTLNQKGLILMANLCTADLLGVARSALHMQQLSRFIFKEDYDNFYLHLKKIFASGESQACELRLIKPDGTLFWAHLQGNFAPEGDSGSVCRIVLNDISDRKQMEKDLRRSEEKYRTVANFTLDWEFWIGVDESMVYCSPSCEMVTLTFPTSFRKARLFFYLRKKDVKVN